MPALTAGTTAPDFNLPILNGGDFSLQEALRVGPVIAAFFKISCPVCQYTLPFLERIYQGSRETNVKLIGVSQNSAKDTARFVREYGISFPILLDDTETYPASNAYGLTNVPTTFWISQDGQIEVSSVGWSRGDIEEINQRGADAAHRSLTPVFQSDESVPEFRAG
jgi:peroxiredoxin